MLNIRVARYFLTQFTKRGKILSNCKLPNVHKMFKMAAVYLFQMAQEYTNLFPFQGPQKFTQIGILGLKIYHLATLLNILLFFKKKCTNFYVTKKKFSKHIFNIKLLKLRIKPIFKA
jgi:hypothetical protein